MRHAPALFVEDAPPIDHLLLAERSAFLQFLPRRGRHVVPEKGPHLVTERQFFLGEAEIHWILL